MANAYTDNYDGIATGQPLSAQKMTNALNTKEKVANKKDTLSGSSTEYPSSKAVYDSLNEKDSGAVHKAGAETITGAKTFGGAVSFADPKFSTAKTTDAANDGTKIATEAQVYKVAQAADILPVGTILAMAASSWINAGATFKSKWRVCDGTGGTPNLTGQFLRGGTASDAVTGGADSVTLTENHIPQHTHGKGTLAAGGTDGLHTHDATSTFHWYDGNSSSTPHYVMDTDPGSDIQRTVHGATSRVIDTVVNNTNSGHGHSVSGNTDSYGRNSATITAIPTVPSYYTVIYIIKLA
ncbi:MAG: hypothetical protein LBJ25_01910 [Candidatus Margulisbacteria bacterium]|jgi:hypothetical protein|nr:hypothetical protein [Candidatus Margulisiibacteriota bacterium]